ncbi:bifunctional enoyl-CoA hydratase/phosphate acetyltransferase [bacterium]|nr:bifunctional enoyl-CoA hydratase/phosphate acetyltransferase [candidate division CSSED10-310 bacterium]
MNTTGAGRIDRSENIIKAAKRICREHGFMRIAVAGGDNPEIVEAVEHAYQEGICRGLFIGDTDRIRGICESLGISDDHHEILASPDDYHATETAADMGSRGEADVILKGSVSTALLLKTVLKKEHNLRVSSLLSHVAVMAIPEYHKLLAITDGAMVVKPDLKERIQIINNAVTVMNCLGVERPKVALLAATDVVNLVMPVTTESAILAKMSDRDQYDNALVDGPLTFDMAVSALPMDYLDIRSPVAGDADIIVVPNLETGNVLIKTLDYFAEARFAGLIVGARIPLSVVSRSDSAFNKLFSVALSVVYSQYMKGVFAND